MKFRLTAFSKSAWHLLVTLTLLSTPCFAEQQSICCKDEKDGFSFPYFEKKCPKESEKTSPNSCGNPDEIVCCMSNFKFFTIKRDECSGHDFHVQDSLATCEKPKTAPIGHCLYLYPSSGLNQNDEDKCLKQTEETCLSTAGNKRAGRFFTQDQWSNLKTSSGFQIKCTNP